MVIASLITVELSACIFATNLVKNFYSQSTINISEAFYQNNHRVGAGCRLLPWSSATIDAPKKIADVSQERFQKLYPKFIKTKFVI